MYVISELHVTRDHSFQVWNEIKLSLFIVFKPEKFWEAVWVWWLILCIILTGIGMPRWSIISGCACEGGRVQMRWAFESMDSVNPLSSSIWWVSSNLWENRRGRKEEFTPFLLPSCARTSPLLFSPALDWNFHCWLSLFSGLWTP